MLLLSLLLAMLHDNNSGDGGNNGSSGGSDVHVRTARPDLCSLLMTVSESAAEGGATDGNAAGGPSEAT